MTITSYPEGVMKAFEEHEKNKRKRETFPLDDALQMQIQATREVMNQILRTAYLLTGMDYVSNMKGKKGLPE